MNYLDLLLRFPDRDIAITAGVAREATDADTEETAPMVETPWGELNVCVIGIHRYNTGTDESPDIIEAPGWWVLVRGPEGYPVPPEIQPLIVDRPDPCPPEIPDRRWF